MMKRLSALLLALLLVTLSAAATAGPVLTIDLANATDEELADAAAQIKAEQKARMKTVIELDPADVTLLKGVNQKVEATVTGLPDGVTAGQYTWSSSDEAIATCKNGTIKGAGAGNAVITCATTLSDGTEVTGEITVTCLLPVKSLAFAGGNKMEVMAGDVFTPEMTVTPEDASDKTVTFTSSDEKVIKVDADGQLVAGINGKATVTATANDGSGKTAKVTVTVTKKIGKYDDELTFQGLEWGSDSKDVYQKLQEIGFVESGSTRSAYNTSSIRYWPTNDLLFAHWESWQSLPVVFRDQDLGAAQLSIDPLMKVGGYAPYSCQMYFLNPVGEDGQIDSEKTELCGIYFYFDNKHERGADIFVDMLSKMESQYGEFTRYMAKNMTRRYYKNLYEAIKSSMEGAKLYKYHDMGKSISLSYYAICTLHGKNNTGIMLMIDTSENVTLFYGKTDTPEKIEAIRKILEAIPDEKQDAGI